MLILTYSTSAVAALFLIRTFAGIWGAAAAAARRGEAASKYSHLIIGIFHWTDRTPCNAAASGAAAAYLLPVIIIVVADRRFCRLLATTSFCMLLTI